jgi:hypothetical protein
MGAADQYVPLPYPGKVVVLWPAEEPQPAAEALRDWRRISPRAEVETIPGDHLTAITVHARELAQRLAAHLASAQARQIAARHPLVTGVECLSGSEPMPDARGVDEIKDVLWLGRFGIPYASFRRLVGDSHLRTDEGRPIHPALNPEEEMA